MLITIEPNITANEIGTIIGTSSRTVETILKKLKESGILERVGANKDGYWKTFL